jgi:hypothetical protein
MEDLKLRMGILVTTTCMLRGEAFKLHPTTLVDAYTTNGKNLRIKMGEGHWGACPTRKREEVCISVDEVKAMAKTKMTKVLENLKEQSINKCLFTAKVNNKHSVTIQTYKPSKTINSLSSGEYVEYVNVGELHDAKISVYNGELPNGVFDNIDAVIEDYGKKCKVFLG